MPCFAKDGIIVETTVLVLWRNYLLCLLASPLNIYIKVILFLCSKHKNVNTSLW
jgi:hypothetical protein